MFLKKSEFPNGNSIRFQAKNAILGRFVVFFPDTGQAVSRPIGTMATIKGRRLPRKSTFKPPKASAFFCEETLRFLSLKAEMKI